MSVSAVDENGMPPSEDTFDPTDILTGGGSDDDDDDDDKMNSDSLDNDNDNDNDKDKENDKDNEPTSEDAPLTTDTLTAKKIECPPGQEYYLFSTSCETVGAVDSTSGLITAKTKNPDGSTTITIKDKDQKPGAIMTTYPNGLPSVTSYFKNGKLVEVYRQDPQGNIVEKTEIPLDDSYTQTSSYVPDVKTPVKVVTDYRDKRQVTETFDGNVRTVGEYNPKDGWTTTKTTDQRSGITTTEITKTNPNGSISTKNPNDNTITTKNKDGTWFITFPTSSDGSVKTYHSDGRTTIEKPK